MTEPSTAPARAQPAATVVLARDAGGEDGLEVHLVQRHGSLGFMGGMHVFPGGKLCADDGSPRMRARVLDAHALCGAHWGAGIDAAAALARAVAGVRETFEEAGVLLGIGEQPSPTLAGLRARLLAGESMSALLEEHALELRLAALQPLARWITPDSEPVRFDTSFYFARAPAHQVAEHDRNEAVSATWISPARALEAAQSGRLRLAPPTARTLEMLSGATSVAAVYELLSQRPIPVVQPVIRAIGDELVLLMPGDPDHPVREPALSGPTRRVLRKL